MNQVVNNTGVVSDLISICANARCLLHHYIYSNPEYIEKFKEILSRHIAYLQMDYNPYEKCFTIKIKKTSLKKVAGFEHSTIFYYNLLNHVLQTFLVELRDPILGFMKDVYGSNAIQVYLFLVHGASAINILNVECYGDNILKIHL